MQEDTLSTYPITIEEKSVDFTSLIMTMFLDNSASDGTDHELDGVYSKDSISSVLDSVGKSLDSNDLQSFYTYLNENYEDIEEYVSAVQYTYDIDLEFYAESGENVEPNSNALIKMINKYSMYYFERETKTIVSFDSNTQIWTITKTDDTDYTFVDQYKEIAFIKARLEQNGVVQLPTDQVTYLSFVLLGMDMTAEGMSSNTMSGLGNMDIFYEMLDNDKLIKEQYDLVGEGSRFPESAGEALLVLDKNHEVDEYMLYALGLMKEEDMDTLLKEQVKGNKLDVKIEYDEILGTEYKILEESDYFIKLSDDTVVDFREYQKTNPSLFMTYYAQALANTTNSIEIVGIVRLNDKSDTGSLNNGVAYTKALTEDMVEYRNNSVAVENEDLIRLSLDTPSTINIYVNSFDSKAVIQDFIYDYNAGVDSEKQITYTDLVGIIMSTVSIIINSITYVLIAFVSVSLIVSSIMIGIITYISVIERTKEIGVLRSVGASKRDVKRVFTAESFIIGLASGLFGILITLILLIPINLLLQMFTGISGLAQLPILGAILLIAISVLLTFIAGLLPAQVAAKKDPVLALRSE